MKIALKELLWEMDAICLRNYSSVLMNKRGNVEYVFLIQVLCYSVKRSGCLVICCS